MLTLFLLSFFRFLLTLVSVLAICNTLLLSIAAAGNGAVALTDSGVYQTFYTASFPTAYIVSVTYLELRVEYLPSQVWCMCVV